MKRVVAMTLAALLLVGCGSAAGGSTSGGTGDAGSSTQAQTPSGGDGGSDTLVLYTARAESLNNAVIENFQADTGIKVEIVTGSTGEVTKRVQSEAANPQGDVLWAGSEAQLSDSIEYRESYVSPEDGNMMYYA